MCTLKKRILYKLYTNLIQKNTHTHTNHTYLSAFTQLAKKHAKLHWNENLIKICTWHLSLFTTLTLFKLNPYRKLKYLKTRRKENTSKAPAVFFLCLCLWFTVTAYWLMSLASSVAVSFYEQGYQHSAVVNYGGL